MEKENQQMTKKNDLKPLLSVCADTQLGVCFSLSVGKAQNRYRQSGCPIKKATIWGVIVRRMLRFIGRCGGIADNGSGL